MIGGWNCLSESWQLMLAISQDIYIWSLQVVSLQGLVWTSSQHACEFLEWESQESMMKHMAFLWSSLKIHIASFYFFLGWASHKCLPRLEGKEHKRHLSIRGMLRSYYKKSTWDTRYCFILFGKILSAIYTCKWSIQTECRELTSESFFLLSLAVEN